MIRDPELGIKLPSLLLPNPFIDYQKWSVVACDQFTSQPEYWEEVTRMVGGAPSTLHLIFPEVYLGKSTDDERIQSIHRRMNEYLNDGTLVDCGQGMIYVERRTGRGHLRQGLILAVDLECYDFHPGSKTLIRATEGTVLERIPPRIKIRDGASLELPHIMLLIDDRDNKVFGAITAYRNQLQKLYDFQLMMNGGELRGYKIDTPELIAKIMAGLVELADMEHFNQKYGLTAEKVLLFAVGDGNHSLATAKAVWENIKVKATDPAELKDHPARYALVEVVNIHDPGLEFEPIHRVIFGVRPELVLKRMGDFFSSIGAGFSYRNASAGLRDELATAKRENPGEQVIGFVTAAGSGYLKVPNPPHNLEVGTLQLFIDEFLKDNPGAGIDYIHGDSVLAEIGSRPGNMGFYLPPMDKGDLFKTVILNGALPRKTFSMGEADEKRYYMECRKISK